MRSSVCLHMPFPQTHNMIEWCLYVAPSQSIYIYPLHSIFDLFAIYPAHSVCADQRPDCQHLLTRTTDMCQRYGDTFAKVKCARTCGLCSGNQTLLDGSPGIATSPILFRNSPNTKDLTTLLKLNKNVKTALQLFH